MLRFEVHDVGHGFCATLSGDGHLTVFDCGHKDYPENRPSKFLPARGCRTVDELVIGNFDQDHVSDLPDLRAALHIESITRNPSMSPEALRKLKREGGGITTAMEAAISLHETYISPSPPRPHRDKLEFANFYNEYGEFSDTNNLSMVTFIHGPRFDIIIPGDLEAAGWRKLLENEAFTGHLRRTSTFVASHHGRESGYCREVFDHCKPEVIVFSDSNVKYATQVMASTYYRHATGSTFNGEPRNVISTRNDGSIFWDIDA